MSRAAARRGLLACALAFLWSAGSAGRQTPNADASIRRGITALHHFEYDDANAAFIEAQRLAPSAVAAFVGEALTYDQVLWRMENVEAARRALARLGTTPLERAGKATSARERDWLAAVEVLFGEGDSRARHARYQAALQALAARYPHDTDFGAWYALVRLGNASRGLIVGAGAHDSHDSQLAGSAEQREIAAILQRVLAIDGRHPGALHYLLHTYDDPDHASLALDAARAYARIARGASHALHMPAHIFLQLGMWSDAAAADRAAFDASTERAARQRLSPALRNFHSLSWLQYELLQLGRYDEAGRLIDEMRAAVQTAAALTGAAPRDAHQPLQSNLSSMRARYVVETRRWDVLAREQQFGNVDELAAIGLSAARRGNAAFAARARELLAARATAPEEGDLRPAIAIMGQEVAAALAFAQGRRADAIGLMQAAAKAELALPAPFGLPEPVKPATEMLGEMLLESGRPAEAIEPFEQTLRRHRNRSQSVLGLARAQNAAGNRAAAVIRYREFLSNYSGADAGIAEVAEARAESQRTQRKR